MHKNSVTADAQLDLFAGAQPTDFVEAVVGLLRRRGYAPTVSREEGRVRIVAARPAQPARPARTRRRRKTKRIADPILL